MVFDFGENLDPLGDMELKIPQPIKYDVGDDVIQLRKDKVKLSLPLDASPLEIAEIVFRFAARERMEPAEMDHAADILNEHLLIIEKRNL